MDTIEIFHHNVHRGMTLNHVSFASQKSCGLKTVGRENRLFVKMEGNMF